MATEGSSTVLFEDSFEVNEVNPKGKFRNEVNKSSMQFKNVARIFAKSQMYDMDLIIDIQCQVFPMKQAEKFTLALASTLDLDGKPDDGVYNQEGKTTLLDSYDYGMHGRVFQYEFEQESKVAIYASYGGLLMKLVGDKSRLKNIDLDATLYCLIKRHERD